ncbi:hypothetical protein Taro_021507, partial [Colocasia esculenta]|nr:hypothetical protein [Colocasia esculenta]
MNVDDEVLPLNPQVEDILKSFELLMNEDGVGSITMLDEKDTDGCKRIDMNVWMWCVDMASDGGSYSGSRPWRHRTTVQQTFPTHSASEGSVVASSAVGSVAEHGRRGPSRSLTDRRLEYGQRWNVKVIGGTGIGESGAQFVSHMGIVSKLHCKIWQKDFVKLPADIIDIIFRDLELLFRWDRMANTDKEMLMHMSSMHRTWRGVLKKRHYTCKSFDDAIASVPAGVNPQDWQIMCAKWNTSEEQNIADRNKTNRSHQSMPYR